MRKFNIAFLAAAICLLLTACGGSPNKEQPPQPVPPQDEAVITVERINEVFAANKEQRPHVAIYSTSGDNDYSYNQQKALAKENYASKKFSCLVSSEPGIRESETFTPHIQSGSEIEYTTEQLPDGVYEVSGTIIANYHDGEVIIGKSDKRIGFSFKYNKERNTATGLDFSVEEPITYIPQIDLSFSSTEEFKNMLLDDYAGKIDKGSVFNYDTYKAEDIADVEVLHDELSDDPQYNMLDKKHYHVLITLNDGRKLYTEFVVRSLWGKATADEIGLGITVE